MTVSKNVDDHYRGLHIVIFNPATGQVESAQVFDTYKSSEQLDAFVKAGVPAGHIVAAACMDECATKLSDAAKQWFRELGSKEIDKLEYRCGFAFIGRSGQTEAHEARAEKSSDTVSVTQIFQLNLDFTQEKVALMVDMTGADAALEGEKQVAPAARDGKPITYKYKYPKTWTYHDKFKYQPAALETFFAGQDFSGVMPDERMKNF